MGPIAGLQNRRQLFDSFRDSPPDAVLMFIGGLGGRTQQLAPLPIIANLTASTSTAYHTQKVRIASVEHARRNGATAVAAHINLYSRFTNSMLEQAGAIVESAQQLGMPSLGIIYPRGETQSGQDDNFDSVRAEEPDHYAAMVAHCAAVGVDLGFDFLKLKFTDRKTFPAVIAACEGRPVLISGGPLVDEDVALELAQTALDTGAAGLSFGRNLFGRRNPADFIKRMRQLTVNK